MWDFSTEPEFQARLDWVAAFVRDEIEPIDLLFPGHADPYDRDSEVYREVVRPLQAQVRDQSLWAAHLPPTLGGMGMGQVRLGLLNEILGRSQWAPMVFGTQAPDSGNADPGGFTCRAIRDGGEWVIDGEKWFASNYPYAAFVIAMVITDPDVPVHQGSWMFIIPRGTPGMEMLRNTGLGGEPLGEGAHGYLRFTPGAGSRRRTCWASRAAGSPSRRPGSAAAACTTRCARSAAGSSSSSSGCRCCTRPGRLTGPARPATMRTPGWPGCTSRRSRRPPRARSSTWCTGLCTSTARSGSRTSCRWPGCGTAGRCSAWPTGRPRRTRTWWPGCCCGTRNRLDRILVADPGG